MIGVGNLSNCSPDICCLCGPNIEFFGNYTGIIELIVDSLPANVGIGIVLETIRTGAMRVIHIIVKTEETQRLRVKFVLYCPICAYKHKQIYHSICQQVDDPGNKQNLPFPLSTSRRIWQQVDTTTLEFKA